jgi:hypothetical protein
LEAAGANKLTIKPEKKEKKKKQKATTKWAEKIVLVWQHWDRTRLGGGKIQWRIGVFKRRMYSGVLVFSGVT